MEQTSENNCCKKIINRKINSKFSLKLIKQQTCQLHEMHFLIPTQSIRENSKFKNKFFNCKRCVLHRKLQHTFLHAVVKCPTSNEKLEEMQNENFGILFLIFSLNYAIETCMKI